MLDIHQLLIDRLQHQGVDFNDSTAFLRDLSKILELSSETNPATVNSKLQLLGWNGVTLDYQSLQLALAWIEQRVPNEHT